TKINVQFDRAVTERSKLFFSVFQPSNRAQFQPCFLFLGIQSAEGRKQVRPKANGQVLMASFQRSFAAHTLRRSSS
ncbi:MAG: hypothetical protein ACRD72_16745, partial [Candidatus Angelobacter sp.]